MSETIIEQADNPMWSGMDPMQALALLSDDDNTYRITWDCGRAEAARRQRVAGNGEVTDEGYVREVAHEVFAALAREDPAASVEVLS